jgi:protease-4
VRIGSHKLAPEQFTRGASDVGRADHQELLLETEKIYLSQVARGRGMSRAEAKRAIAKGPFIATEARSAKLVDQLVYEDEISRFAEEVVGRSVQVVDYKQVDRAPAYWRDPPGVAIVYLWGDMIDGNSQKIPIIGIRLAGSYTIAKSLKQVREDPSIKAVVFRVETGGGSSLASDVILRELTLTAKKKPVVVSMGSKAASGGYYAASGATEIFSNRATLTGSIGIFYGKVDLVGLMDKLGVRTEDVRSGPRADAESLFRPFSDEERTELGKKVKQFYDLFIGRVADGRKMSPAEVHAVAQGKVWTGAQASTLGLVDHVGGLRQALARARRLANLPKDAPILELPDETPTLFERALTLIGVPSLQSGGALWTPPPILEIARALAPFMVYEPGKPLALMDMVITEP